MLELTEKASGDQTISDSNKIKEIYDITIM
jgi:hypothetical protein